MPRVSKKTDNSQTENTKRKPKQTKSSVPSKKTTKKPVRLKKIDLREHNKVALAKVENVLQDSNKVVLIQPMGTGKTYVFLSYIRKIFAKSRKILVVVPTKTIEHAHKQNGAWSPSLDEKVTYITYSMIGRMPSMSETRLRRLGLYNLDLVVFDEVHHIGAPTWSAGYELLQKLNPDCKFIGLTATPIRYLDNGVDVVKRYFDSNGIEVITLPKAIKEKILPKPIYVNAFFDLKHVEEEGLSKINNSYLSDAEKESVYNQLRRKVDWAEQQGVSGILDEHIRKNVPSTVSNIKIIVFMPSISELEEYHDTVIEWFESINLRKNIKSFILHSASDEKDKDVITSFSRKHKDCVDIIFAVNKLNEGVHIKGVSAAIMMRSTVSPIICYQQLGRILASDPNSSPILFDFVNNFGAIQVVRNMLLEDGDKPKVSTSSGDTKILEYDTMTLYDETSDITSFLSDALDKKPLLESMWESNSDENWQECFTQFVFFVSEHNTLPTQESNYDMFVWLRWQLSQYRGGVMPEERVNKFSIIGVSFG